MIPEYRIGMKQKLPRDRFGDKITAGCTVSVQMAGEFPVYEKDGELWFEPYGKPERPMDYFMNDMMILTKEPRK